jgi:hypothetical protein
LGNWLSGQLAIGEWATTMTLFVGGPYDGQDLPIDPERVEHIRLPSKDPMDAFLQETLNSKEGMLPHLYSADKSVSPVVYRFVRTMKHE